MKGINFVQATIEAGLIPPLINILQKVSVGGSSRSGGANLYVCTVIEPAMQICMYVCTVIDPAMLISPLTSLRAIICAYVRALFTLFDLTELTSGNKAIFSYACCICAVQP